MVDTAKIEYSEAYLQYLKKPGFLRHLIRKLYLQNIRKYCKGKTIDFGCGIGELLKILPAGSIGYEVNKMAVQFCTSKGLNVELYDPGADDYSFKTIPIGEFSSFTMNHVLEHLENPAEIVKKIFASCARLGIQRIVFTVPGYKGFQSDKTHLTFVDKAYFQKEGLVDNKLYVLKYTFYFPVQLEGFGHYFTHNELRFVFDKLND